MDVFQALADPTRRQVVQLLGRRPRRAGELAGELGTSASALSRHLKLLLDASIIEDERIPDDARVRMFRLRPDSLEDVQAYLDQLQAEWRDQLQAFKRHVEAQQS
ncbi:MAG: metalloregulator ArsR/SmtB family transcription factor [Woeseiaceae bacterium]|nr:metalloregulator ArsR/SmtB family transcription factor [Woeseiaceae bacterium]